MMIFLVCVKPLDQEVFNNLEMLNEIFILISSYFMYLFTDFVPDAEMRLQIGWIYVMILSVNFAINWLGIMASAVLRFYLLF